MPESARSSPLFPPRTPDPASTHPALPHPPDPRYPGLQATPRRFMHQSRNVSACPAPLMTHRHIYFAGTLGSLQPGKLADFVVLDGNPLDAEPEAIPGIGILATVLGGTPVYQSDSIFPGR
jgi:Amidohydrolase family